MAYLGMHRDSQISVYVASQTDSVSNSQFSLPPNTTIVPCYKHLQQRPNKEYPFLQRHCPTCCSVCCSQYALAHLFQHSSWFVHPNSPGHFFLKCQSINAYTSEKLRARSDVRCANSVQAEFFRGASSIGIDTRGVERTSANSVNWRTPPD